MIGKLKHTYHLYGLLGCFSLLSQVIYTKLFFKTARLIRRPFDIRGKKHIYFSKGFTSGRYCRIEAHSLNKFQGNIIEFGVNCQINDSVHIAAAEKISFGDNVLIASRVFITDLNHGSYKGQIHSHPDTICRERELQANPVRIDDNVWLGEGVVVLPGVKIGKSSIIGANSVVTRSIPAYSIAAGNPAKIIKQFDFQRNEWVNVNG
ncbi:Putative acetyltransferase SACOL2570 [Cedecea davisae]|uniref:Bacterial transferase hexapeptide repeat protein n=1 Tax=Cedecea davisae DSM 4568 TaxID=566551 RepID=S3IQC6_9ENTR|nr:DapH/DapD/GlmU-related protein [Cedecea davisae]EPF16008.1 bacterial transferase hexapeptide repeat protein [Cedecea davisae DSM 4568]SUX38684.1 Putative acetyltransferase SACOL2570 [Cedecea davisae]